MPRSVEPLRLRDRSGLDRWGCGDSFRSHACVRSRAGLRGRGAHVAAGCGGRRLRRPHCWDSFLDRCSDRSSRLVLPFCAMPLGGCGPALHGRLGVRCRSYWSRNLRRDRPGDDRLRGLGLRRWDLDADGRRRSGHRRLGHRRRRWCRRPRRQQAQRVDIAVRVGGDANTEVDVWLRGDGVAALADRAHLSSLGHRVAPRNARRAELQQRDGVAVVGGDRDHVATAGHDAGERDASRGRRHDGAAELCADVDAPVLACGVRVGADGEGPQHGSFGRPGPGERARCESHARKHDGDHH